MLCIWYLFLCIASVSSFESSAILIELSLLTKITTGLMKYSSEHFSNLIICLSSISFLSSFSTLSIRWMGTLLPFCCVGLKYCLNVDLAMWFFDFPKRVHRCGKFLKIFCVICFWSGLMKLIVFSPCFVCVRWIPNFCSMSLPSRFTVLCGTTSISQSFATEFPDERCNLSVLVILILLLLKHRNSPSLGVLFCISFPSLFIKLFAVCCDMKLLGLPVKTCAEVGLPREVTLTLSYGVSRI